MFISNYLIFIVHENDRYRSEVGLNEGLIWSTGSILWIKLHIMVAYMCGNSKCIKTFWL